jgi:hypothetical protein
MPGYWNRPATGQSERKEPAYRQPEPWGGGGGGGDEQRKQASQQANLDRIRREAEARNRQQQEINAEASRQAQAASQALHAQQMQKMARDMQSAGQISGGLSGGTYTKGPVVYPKSFYTDEGWSEVQNRGWSDKLVDHEIQGKTPSQWILSADDPAQAGGKLRDLDEGVIYSTAIGDPERGWGGFKRVSNFSGDSRDGGTGGYGGYGMWSPGYGGGYGGSGYAAGMPYIPGAQEGMGYSEPSFATDPMQAWMVGVNTPQYAARGGIMSLRR